MKLLLVTALALLSFSIARATELEVRIFQLSGEQALPSDIIRFSEAGILPSTASFATAIGRDGGFSHSALKSVTCARSYNNAGKPKGTQNRDTGFSFAGRASVADNLYSLTFEFTTSNLKSVRIQRSNDGTVFPVPAFQSRTIKSSVQLPPADTWVALPIPGSVGTPKDDAQTVFLLRIRK